MKTKIYRFKDDLSDYVDFKNTYLITKIDNFRKDDLNNFKRRIEFCGIKLNGIFLIE